MLTLPQWVKKKNNRFTNRYQDSLLHIICALHSSSSPLTTLFTISFSNICYYINNIAHN